MAEENSEKISELKEEIESLKTSLAEKEKISAETLIDFERRLRDVEGILEAHFLQ